MGGRCVDKHGSEPTGTSAFGGQAVGHRQGRHLPGHRPARGKEHSRPGVRRRGRPGARRRRLAIRTDAAIRSGRLVGVDNSPLTGEVQHRKRLAQNPLHDRPDQKKVATLLVQPSARSDELDQLLWAEVTRHLQHPDLILKACRAPREEFPAHQDRQLAELRGPQRRLLDAYQSGAISLPELEARRRPLDDRVRELEQSAQSAQRRSHTKAQLQQQLNDFSDQIAGRLSTMDFAERQRLVR
jgi:hypothetical protein